MRRFGFWLDEKFCLLLSIHLKSAAIIFPILIIVKRLETILSLSKGPTERIIVRLSTINKHILSDSSFDSSLHERIPHHSGIVCNYTQPAGVSTIFFSLSKIFTPIEFQDNFKFRANSSTPGDSNIEILSSFWGYFCARVDSKKSHWSRREGRVSTKRRILTAPKDSVSEESERRVNSQPLDRPQNPPSGFLQSLIK